MDQMKKIGAHNVKVFKIQNRRGFAAVCEDHLTEGDTAAQALDRMDKALKRTQHKSV